MGRKKAKKKNTLFKWILILVTLFFLLIAAGCAAVMTVGNALVDQGKVKEQIESTTIYDKNGKEVYKLYIENREYIHFQQIPDFVVKAFVNTEDERFYSHRGVDLIAVARAIYKDIKAGAAVEGASTITQQLAKNVYLGHEKTFWRKTKEALIALNLERNYSKDQILEFYLNEIYFGHGAHGIQAASKLYFGKDVQNLTLSEAATLAGLPKAPNTYSPFNNYEKAIERRNVVLSLMEKNGSITAEEKAAAMKEELKLASRKGKNEGVQAYVDFLLEEAQEKYGLTENQLYRGGYKIYTEMDSKAQDAMIKAFNNPKLFPDGRSGEKVQASMVILDHQTGGIVAMSGGRDYTSKGFNRAVSRNRSPGSTFKPLAVYAPALERGWHPFDLLKDEKMTFPGGYTPRNYGDAEYLGQVTMYDALKTSKNVPAVWLLNEIGIDTSFRYLDRFGIPYDKKEDRKLGIALGGLTHGVSPLDMAKAYSAFANKGVIVEPHVIAMIKDREDNVIAKAEVQTATVISEQTAYYITRMLEAAVKEGTGKNARMSRPVAGKTGTTEQEGTNGKGIRDAWFVGYTPEYVGAVWMGYDHPNSKTNYLTKGSSVTAAFFKVVMEEALKGREVKPFVKPKGAEELHPPVRLDKITDLQAQQIADSIHLYWTGSEDQRVIYRIFRYAGDPNQAELIGETEYHEWIDLAVPASDQPMYYFVVPFDPLLKREGQVSNVIQILPATVDPELLPPEEDPPQEQPEDSEEMQDPFVPPAQSGNPGEPAEPGPSGQRGQSDHPDQPFQPGDEVPPIDDLILPDTQG